MRIIRMPGMICGLKEAKHIALKKGNGAKAICVMAFNGYAYLRKCGRGYTVDTVTEKFKVN